MEILGFLLKCAALAASLSQGEKKKLIDMDDKNELREGDKNELEKILKPLLSRLIKEADETPYPCIKELIAYTVVKELGIKNEKFYNELLIIINKIDLSANLGLSQK